MIEWNVDGGMPCGNYLQILAIETEKSVEEIFAVIVEKIEYRVRLLNARETITSESEFEVEGVKLDAEDFIYYDEWKPLFERFQFLVPNVMELHEWFQYKKVDK